MKTYFEPIHVGERERERGGEREQAKILKIPNVEKHHYVGKGRAREREKIKQNKIKTCSGHRPPSVGPSIKAFA